jgi:SAM-dependent methyltransferase
MRKTNDQKRLYQDLAWLWPVFGTPEEYAPCSRDFARIIKNHSKLKVKSLLHLGCGGGLNDLTLKKYFRLTGVDLNRPMLALARKLNPEVTYVRGDMRHVKLKEKFDAIIAPDSIDYLTRANDLRLTLKNAYNLLNPGGVFLIAAENTAETFRQNTNSVYSRLRGKIELTLIENVFDPEPKDTSYEATFVYLIRKQGKLRIETDQHLLGLFPLKVWKKLIRAAGFRVKALNYLAPPPEQGSFPMFICCKPR